MSGERCILLKVESGELRESQNDVVTSSLLVAGWVDVTGVPEFEKLCTERLHRDVKPTKENWGKESHES